MTNPDLARLTGDWFPHLPEAHEKSIVLGAGKVLFPVADPQAQAEILAAYVSDVAQRAFRAGQQHAKQKIREAMW
jgi:hypothetical protein